MQFNEFKEGEAKKEEQISATRTSRTGPSSAISSKAAVLVFENSANYEWLTTQEAAKYLRISPKCLLNMTSNGKIRYFKFGRRNRFLLSELRELLLAHPRGGSHGS